MLTRKDFRAMAEAISKIADVGERVNQFNRVAELCAQSNPRFSREIFKSACGIATLPPICVS